MVYDVDFQPGRKARLYVPKTPEPRPAILLLHGSDGSRTGWTDWTALALAMHGFVTMGMPYGHGKNGNAWHAGDIADVELEDTAAALKWLRDEPCTTDKVGLYGVSRGAEHAILLASLMAKENLPGQPDALAVHAPSDTIVGAFIAAEWHPTAPESSDPSRHAWQWRGQSDALTPTTPIELELYDGPIQLSHGTRDSVWTVECTRRLESRLKAAGRNPEANYYEGEDHWLRPGAFNLAHGRLIDFFKRHLRG